MAAFALVCVLLLASYSTAEETTSTTVKPTVAQVDFTHDNVRCTCSCPEQTLNQNSTDEANECSQKRFNYDIILGGDRRLAQETCKECSFSRGQRVTSQCSYIVVMESENQCTCDNILPQVGQNSTRRHKDECVYGMCICTYEFRNQNLIKGIVIFYFVILGILLSITAFNIFPHGLFTLKPYGLSLRDPDMPLPKLYSPRNSRVTSPTPEGTRRTFTARLQRLLHWDILRRQPKVRDIGY